MGALRAADRAVEVAGRMNSGARGTCSAGFDDRFLHVSALARRATVLHRMGRTAEPGQTFDEATRLHGGPLTRANAYYHGLYLADVTHGRDAKALLHLGLHNLSAASERGDLGDIGYSLLLTAHARRASGEPARDHGRNHTARIVAGSPLVTQRQRGKITRRDRIGVR